jgi:hypothetical protein
VDESRAIGQAGSPVAGPVERGHARELRDAGGVPAEPGRLEVGDIREAAQQLVEPVVVDGSPRMRLRVDHGVPQVFLLDARKQCPGIVEQSGGDRGVECAA